MIYSSSMLARLAFSDAARELSEQLVGQAGTYSDSYGRGAFLTEEAAGLVQDARALLKAAVTADRLRGASWAKVGDALEITRQSAHERFGEAEREFQEAVLFPHREREDGGLGYTPAPYAVEEPDQVRERLDSWVVERRRSSGPDRDEPEPVTRGLAAMAEKGNATIDQLGQLLQLSEALLGERLPDGVTERQARRRHQQLRVEVYEQIAAQRPDDLDVARQLKDARAQRAAHGRHPAPAA